jgi:hypothetical protein
MGIRLVPPCNLLILHYETFDGLSIVLSRIVVSGPSEAAYFKLYEVLRLLPLLSGASHFCSPLHIPMQSGLYLHP